MKRRRRGNGEGTVQRRADGRWEARISVPGGQRKSIYGPTFQAVQQKLLDARRALAKGSPPVPPKTRLDRFLGDWLKAESTRLGPRTFERYEQYVRLHISPQLGKLPLAQLKPEIV